MPDTTSNDRFIIILGLGLLGLFIFTVAGILSPFTVALAVVTVLVPFRNNTVVRAMLWLTGLLFTLWFLQATLGALMPVLVALVLAYMLDPLVDMLQRRRIPRAVSAITILLAFIGLLVTVIILIVPVLIDSFQAINPQAIISSATTWIDTTLVPWLIGMGVQQADLDAFVDTKLLPGLEAASNSVLTGLLSLGTGLAGILGQLANLFIIPITMLYILIDFDRIRRWVRQLFPPHRQATASRIYQRINAIMGAYLRGAITIGLINAVVVSILFSIFGIPFAVVLGLLSGLFCLIPQFGIFITIGISALFNLFSPTPGTNIIICIVILLAENTLESSVLYPRIVGSVLGLHPVALIASLFVFSSFLGFIGMLLAVPVTSLLARFLEDYLEARDTPSEGIGSA